MKLKILLCLVQFVSKFWNISVFQRIPFALQTIFSLHNIEADNFFSQLQLANIFYKNGNPQIKNNRPSLRRLILEKTLLLLYQAMIDLYFRYCSTVWGQCEKINYRQYKAELLGAELSYLWFGDISCFGTPLLLCVQAWRGCVSLVTQSQSFPPCIDGLHPFLPLLVDSIILLYALCILKPTFKNFTTTLLCHNWANV